MATKTVTGIPAAINLLVYAGDDLYLDLSVTNVGAPADLTGYSAKAQIRATPADTAILATLTATIAGSTVHLHLVHTDAATLSGSAVWDCQLTDPIGNISTIAAGTVTVTPDVTRP
jgi:hypothetical protein